MVGRPTSCPPIRVVIAMLALASGSAGCQFSPSAQAGVDGGVIPEPGADARRPDAAVIDAREIDARPDAAGPPSDAAVLPPEDELVERDLLTRYFIDEDNSGASVSELDDSASNPLPLTIDYAGQGQFVDENGNFGLRWNALTQTGRASALVTEDNKIWQALDGSTRGTIEVVVDIDQFVPGSRISHFGRGGDRGIFTLRLEEPARVRFVLNNDATDQTDWDVTLVGAGRKVLHLVLDTSRATAAERVRLYVDGVEVPQSAGTTTPPRNEAITILDAQPYYVLGNTIDGQRGILGTIFYAAMYSAALDPAEVEHNADILRTNDDTPEN